MKIKITKSELRQIFKDSIPIYQEKIKVRENAIRKASSDPLLKNWGKYNDDNKENLLKLKSNLNKIIKGIDKLK